MKSIQAALFLQKAIVKDVVTTTTITTVHHSESRLATKKESPAVTKLTTPPSPSATTAGKSLKAAKVSKEKNENSKPLCPYGTKCYRYPTSGYRLDFFFHEVLSILLAYNIA